MVSETQKTVLLHAAYSLAHQNLDTKTVNLNATTSSTVGWWAGAWGRVMHAFPRVLKVRGRSLECWRNPPNHQKTRHGCTTPIHGAYSGGCRASQRHRRKISLVLGVCVCACVRCVCGWVGVGGVGVGVGE